MEENLENVDYEAYGAQMIEDSGLDPKVERAKAVATLVVVCIVNVLNVCGYAVDAGPLLNVIGSVASAASILYAWWKNNNITDAAVAGQSVLNRIKNAKHAREQEEEE